MIQKDRDAINRLIEVVKEVKNYTDALGQIKVLRERLRSMDLRISELQMQPSTHVLEDWLARLEDRMQDQHEEIAILRGQTRCCGQQGTSCWISRCARNLTDVLAPPMLPPIASLSSEEEERSELDYANDPPIPHVEGTVPGTGCMVSKRLSEANSPVVDWDGTPSEYLTPHLTLETGSNILVPLPGRWSGGYGL